MVSARQLQGNIKPTSTLHYYNYLNLLRLQEESKSNVNSLKLQEGEITRLAITLGSKSNTIFPKQWLHHIPHQYQAHLERISDFLVSGPGSWWRELHGDIEFFDAVIHSHKKNQPTCSTCPSRAPTPQPTCSMCPSRAPTPQPTRSTCPSPPPTPHSLHSTCMRTSRTQAAKILKDSLLQSNQAKPIAKVLPTDNEVTEFDRLRTVLKAVKDKQTTIPSKLQKRYDALSNSLKSKLVEAYRAHNETLNTWKADFETKHGNTPQKQDYPQALRTVNHTKELAQTILLHQWKHTTI